METKTLIEIGKAAARYGPAVVEALVWLWGALLRWLGGSADEDAVRVADVLPRPLLSRLEMVRGRAGAEAIIAEELAAQIDRVRDLSDEDLAALTAQASTLGWLCRGLRRRHARQRVPRRQGSIVDSAVVELRPLLTAGLTEAQTVALRLVLARVERGE